MSWEERQRRFWEHAKERWGVEANYYAPGGAVELVTVIFRREYDSLFFSDAGAVSSSSPVAFVRPEDFNNLPEKLGELDPLEGDRYRIVDVRPDGKGNLVLPLEKV